jgi:dihydroorotase-like cyclic amidohydrolase
VAELLVRGGTVVTAAGSKIADVHVQDGSITAIEADLSRIAESAAVDVVDATGLLVLPGAVDVHTHTRVATDAEPDRFFQDSVAAAFGGTTTFLAFNNPGTGSSPAAERSLLAGLREWRAATNKDSAVDYAVSLAISGRMEDPVGELPAMVD